MLKWLPVRVVVNNKRIYPLVYDEPIVVPLEEDHPDVVLTDGFHYSKSQQLHFNGPGYFNFEVGTSLSDWRLFKAGILMLWLFVSALITGFLFYKIASILPVVVALIWYYFKRRSFLKLRQIKSPYLGANRAGV